MNATTVKIHLHTKNALDGLKSERESYDDVIGKLISQVNKKNLEKNLIAAYRQINKKDLKVLKEWEASSAEIDL